MKTIFIFLVLIIFILFTSSEAKKTKKKKKSKKIKKELDPQIATCILTNNKASMSLKSHIFDHRDDDLSEILDPYNEKIDKNDKEVIKECANKVNKEKGDL